MDSGRWRRLEQLYHAALEQEPARRDSFLADACGEDSGLRREVESLLTQSCSSSMLIDRSAWAIVGGVRAETRKDWRRGEALGPYRILELLGEGGMGAVYEALDTRLNRKVAVKVCHERFGGGFEREVRAISALNHPNICTLYDVGSDYLVVELVEGDTLRALLRRRLPTERSLNIAMQVLAALGAAHRAGIVHRDLKPANIMVRADGYVKVLDFGLAKRIPGGVGDQRESAATLDISVPGQILGTAAYMSPEQIVGHDVGPQSDLFAFGVILYEMLTGQHPWPRDSAVDTLHAILHDEPPPIEGDSPFLAELGPILEKLLSKNSLRRFESAEAVSEALARPSGQRAITTRAAKPLTSIAVLPFALLSDVDGGKAFSLGFADALINMLGNLDEIVVAPTSAILKYASDFEPVQVSRDLGVRHTLQGNVQKIGAEWRVSVQLFDVAAHRITFSEVYDFLMENVFEVQDEIGRRVVNALSSRRGRIVTNIGRRYSSNPEAYKRFMAGLRESYSVRYETLQSAVEHLSAAIEHDPEFALAHAWLAYVTMNIHFSFDPTPARVETAERHYRLALAIDAALPEANLAKAFILWSPAKNFQHAEAIAALEQVLEARPHLEQAHNRMCSICNHIGRLEEARIALENAQRANPKNLQIPARHIALTHLWSGDFAQAEKAGEAWIRESPGDPQALWHHSQPALMNGDLNAAEWRLTAALKLRPDDPLLISLQAMLHARRGQTGLAMETAMRALSCPVLNGHTHHLYYQIACVYAVLREADQAMAWLERSAESGFPCWPFFKVDPHLENLRYTPAFSNLVSDLEREWTALKIGRL